MVVALYSLNSVSQTPDKYGVTNMVLANEKQNK